MNSQNTSLNKAYYQALRFKRALIKASYDLTPPVLWRSLFKLRRADHSPAITNNKAYANRFSLNGIHPKHINFRYGLPVIDVPTHKIRYANGISYLHPEHQMFKFYQEGETGLKDYYDKHQPKNIFEKVFLKAPDRSNIPIGGLPWRDFENGTYVTATTSEKGLNSTHGIQHYGPVSKNKIALEAERLTLTKNSIQKNGFIPELGFPTGYFLCNKDNDWVFMTVSGQHRTAAMAALNFTVIPIQLMSTMPRIIHEHEVAYWPMVASGELSQDEALEIFHAFFQEKRKLQFAHKR